MARLKKLSEEAQKLKEIIDKNNPNTVIKSTAKKQKEKREYTKAVNAMEGTTYKRCIDYEDDCDGTLATYTPAEYQQIRQEIESNMPNEIKKHNERIQQAYINQQFVERRCKVDNPHRYWRFENKQGEEITMDLHVWQVYNGVLAKGGTEEQAEEARQYKNKYLLPSLKYLAEVKRVYRVELGLTATSTPAYDHALLIIDWFGKFNTIEDVRKKLKVNFDLVVKTETLRQIYRENKDAIERAKSNYVLAHKDFKIATDSGRLEVLNDLLTDLQLKYQNNPSDDTLIDRMVKLLEQARKECKGEQIKLTVDGKIDINASIQGSEQIMSAMRGLNINSLVIGLTAAKAGLNPTVLIGQLASSWYKDISGFNGNVVGTESFMLPSALIRQYDWGVLEEKSREFINDMSSIEEALVIEDVTEKKKIEGKRSDILGLINKYK